ncbi:MAG: FecR domain-containing protein [Proteobacteria bacterium]|nr:FecR domain-containing protein [Pseudomonadota bacterium]
MQLSHLNIENGTPYRLLTALLLITLSLVPALTSAGEPAGDVLRVTGRATVTSTDGNIVRINKGTTISSQDIVSTSARSYVRLKMQDSSYIMVRPDSRLVIEDFRYNKKEPEQNRSFLSLLKGGFRAVTGFIKNKKKYGYRTTVATIGIRGTDISVQVCALDCYDVDPVPPNGMFFAVNDGEAIITTGAGEFPFKRGQYAYVADKNSPAVLLDEAPDIFLQRYIPGADPASCKE